MTLQHFRFSIYHELSRAQQLLHTDDLPVGTAIRDEWVCWLRLPNESALVFYGAGPIEAAAKAQHEALRIIQCAGTPVRHEIDKTPTT